MGLFQKSVLNKYKKLQDKKAIEKAFKKYIKYFHNPQIQQNIRESKEEQYQEGFLRELFVNILDYTINPNPNFNLTTELKNEKGAKKADGAILSRGLNPLEKSKAIAVIELKGTKTKDLESIRQQAFDYKANQSSCVYVITSNFEKLRFYINNAVEFEEFNLFTLNAEQFELLYLCLHKENLLQNIPLKIKTDSVIEEEKITKTFYTDYSVFKRELFRDLVKKNVKNEVFRDELQKEDNDRATKNIKLSLFKKSQKLIDRFLFIFFAEDKGLLPPNSTLQILNKWKSDWDFGDERPLYNLFKQYFKFLDIGRQGTQSRAEIFAYNGGLFKPDAILDSLLIDNDLLHKHTKKLSDYDFESQVGVNILGHIFENSLNEIESVNAEIEGQEFDKQKTKRKKDGVFYTPKYITKYIVDNTVGKLCEEKKAKLSIVETEYQKSRKGRKTDTIKKLKTNLDTYRKWLLEITILDPACGSGAFLNQALDFLIKEHTYIDELETSLFGSSMVFQNIENTILEKNIFGVDLNEESVEIAKLSLWLRTAQPRRKLNSLNNNIKCGNSLIDDPKIAGDKAFNWQNEFPNIFKEKNKKIYHITTATHNSRYSKRMFDNYIKLGEPVWLEKKEEILITKTIAEIAIKDKLNILEYNICGDHMHLLLVCEKEEVPKIVGKLKAMSSRAVNIASGKTVSATSTTREHVPLSGSYYDSDLDSGKKKYNSLWTQKFGESEIKDDNYLNNTLEYIQNNRVKHKLPKSKEIEKIKKEFLCTSNHAFRTEYNGGFDVVIGNPPWNSKISSVDSKEIAKKYDLNLKNLNMFSVFFYLGHKIVKKNGLINLLVPEVIIKNSSYLDLRNLIINKYNFISLTDYGQFPGVASNTVAVCYQLKPSENNTTIRKCKNGADISKTIDPSIYNENPIKAFSFEIDNEKQKIINKTSKNPLLGEISKIKRGIELGQVTELVKCEQCDKYSEISTKYYTNREVNKCKYCESKIDLNTKFCISSRFRNEKYTIPCLSGKEVNRYLINDYYYIIPSLKNIDYKAQIFSKENLFVKRIATKPEATVVKNITFSFNTLYAIYDLKINSKKSILLILNSKLIHFYYELVFNLGMNLTTQITIEFLKKIPIAKIENDESFIYLADTMLKLNKNYINNSTNFTKYLQSTLGFSPLLKLPKKLQNWHDLEFADFIKELNKTIKKHNKEVATATTTGFNPLPILSKLDEMDWMDVFETKKAEAQSLKVEIDKTDTEIDQMVYELYELTPEEITIIENSSIKT